jgi:hypothetical protein
MEEGYKEELDCSCFQGAYGLGRSGERCLGAGVEGWKQFCGRIF